jgi:hypothetical protein
MGCGCKIAALPSDLGIAYGRSPSLLELGPKRECTDRYWQEERKSSSFHRRTAT